MLGHTSGINVFSGMWLCGTTGGNYSKEDPNPNLKYCILKLFRIGDQTSLVHLKRKQPKDGLGESRLSSRSDYCQGANSRLTRTDH